MQNQRRDLRNEFIVAGGVLLALIFVLVFAVLLSGSDVSPMDATETALAALPSATLTTTGTSAPATEETVTASPSVTVTQSATATPTQTRTPTLTATASPTLTNTAEPTPADTQTSTQTPNATSEPVLAPSREPSVTHTPTLSPTPTQRPTQTASPVATSAQTTTATPRRDDVGILPTPTPPPSPTPRALDEPTRVPATCERPQGWTTYEVQSGNTLFAIALATRSTLDELRYRNCIDDVDTIEAGQVIFVPRAPIEPVATSVPSDRQGVVRIGCTTDNATITSPIAGQRLSGTFTVYGSATLENFWYYKLEIRPDWAKIYNFYGDAQTSVQNGELAQVNADIFDNGLHWLRLSVVNDRAQILPEAVCEVPVYFN